MFVYFSIQAAKFNRLVKSDYLWVISRKIVPSLAIAESGNCFETQKLFLLLLLTKLQIGVNVQFLLHPTDRLPRALLALYLWMLNGCIWAPLEHFDFNASGSKLFRLLLIWFVRSLPVRWKTRLKSTWMTTNILIFLLSKRFEKLASLIFQSIYLKLLV